MKQNPGVDDAVHLQSHLFTVRLWANRSDHPPEMVRGKVQHVLSGEVCYFSEWGTLQDFLLAHSECGEPPE